MVTLESGIGNYIRSNGRKYSYFGGNNYLGLANHPEVKKAVISSLKKYGVNFSASRCTTGTSDIHLELERQLSLFKGKEDTVVFASGYQGNSILLETLKDRYSIILADQNAHASITSGVPRGTKIIYYSHRDPGHLEELLSHHQDKRALIITDGVFALTGEIAPLDKLFRLAKKHHCLLVTDDAHSTGILGETGKGTPEHFGLTDAPDIFQAETMSKALGGYGGFISGSMELTRKIREKSSVYQASTALPPPVVAAGLVSLKIIRENPDLRLTLLKKSMKIRKEIAGAGFNTTSDNTSIIPLIFKSEQKARALSSFLESKNIIVPFLNYPSGNKTDLLRIAITASHTDRQLEMLLDRLNKWIKDNGKDQNY